MHVKYIIPTVQPKSEVTVIHCRKNKLPYCYIVAIKLSTGEHLLWLTRCHSNIRHHCSKDVLPSETKIDEPFPNAQFSTNGYKIFYQKSQYVCED